MREREREEGRKRTRERARASARARERARESERERARESESERERERERARARARERERSTYRGSSRRRWPMLTHRSTRRCTWWRIRNRHVWSTRGNQPGSQAPTHHRCPFLCRIRCRARRSRSTSRDFPCPTARRSASRQRGRSYCCLQRRSPCRTVHPRWRHPTAAAFATHAGWFRVEIDRPAPRLHGFPSALLSNLLQPRLETRLMASTYNQTMQSQ